MGVGCARVPLGKYSYFNVLIHAVEQGAWFLPVFMPLS